MSAAAALDGLEARQAGVGARLRSLRERVPPARAFATSALDDHARLERERAELRRRLRLPAAAPAPAAPDEADLSLSGLRQAQDELVYAYAEALPEVSDDPAAVDLLARHLIDCARHLTVIDLWIQAEDERA